MMIMRPSHPDDDEGDEEGEDEEGNPLRLLSVL